MLCLLRDSTSTAPRRASRHFLRAQNDGGSCPRVRAQRLSTSADSQRLGSVDRCRVEALARVTLSKTVRVVTVRHGPMSIWEGCTPMVTSNPFRRDSSNETLVPSSPGRDVMFVVGNGLAMDLADRCPRLNRDWNTQRPLSWRIILPDSKKELLALFPLAKAVIERMRHAQPNLSDFGLFDAAIQELGPQREALGRALASTEHWGFDLTSFRATQDYIRLTAELRHFIAMSYSHYQWEADRFVTMNSWPWGNFLRSIADRLQLVVSFNYDLNVESLLESAGRELFHVGVSRGLGQVSTSAVPIAKPHGSIDYRPRSGNIVIPGRPQYPVNNVFELADMPIETMPRSEIRRPRLTADVVLPAEASEYSDFQWVRPVRQWASRLGSRTSYLILMGLSYWSVDRPEIDSILNSVSSGATAIVANPHPDSDLLTKLRQRFSDVREWTDGPRLVS